jgi:hypothetical protein
LIIVYSAGTGSSTYENSEFSEVGEMIQVGEGLWMQETVTQSIVLNEYYQYVSELEVGEDLVTCFNPDLPGTYTAEFIYIDYCDTLTYIFATVTANCNNPPTVNLESTISVLWEGVGFITYIEDDDKRSSNKRNGDEDKTEFYYAEGTSVPLSASVSDSDGDSVSVEWSIISDPYNAVVSEDGNTNYYYSWIENPNSIQATFFPYAPGTYVIQLDATDGCTVVTETVTVTVSCTANFTAPDAISFTSDGYIPVVLTTFSLVVEPRCDYELSIEVIDYDPSTATPPPSPPGPNSPGHSSDASLHQISMMLLVTLFMFLQLI